MDRTLFVSDLDGTLLNSDGWLSDASVRILNEVIGRGGLFSIATARTPATVSKILRDVNMRVPVIVMTGSLLWNPVTGEFMNPKFHRPEDVVKLRDTLNRHKIPFFQYVLGSRGIEVYHEGPVSSLEKSFMEERSGTPFKTFHVDDAGLCAPLPDRTDNVLLFYALQPKDGLAPAFGEMCGYEGVNVLFYDDIYDAGYSNLEMFPETASKAEAVDELKRITKADRIVAYGDNYNDIPLFDVADESVSVRNAVEALRKRSSREIGPNTADSVARDILDSLNREKQTNINNR